MENMNMPELEALEKIAGQYDFLVQEGVQYSMKEKERALFLLSCIEQYLIELPVEKGND